MTHSISIIIIDKNDRGIAATLDAIRTQRKPLSTEIIVVDASHPDVLKDIKDAHPESTWYQFIPKNPNKSSIPEQRNYGVTLAKGDIIVFTDASCVPGKDWLANLTEPLILDEEEITAGPFGVNATHRGLHGLEEDKDGPSKKHYISCSGTGNLAFQKKVWEDVSGFDEAFLYGSDIDFTWRCRDKGYRIRFIPDAPVSHNWGTWREDLRRSFKYGKARADLFYKHPKRILKQLTNEVALLVVYTVWLLGLTLIFILPWYPLTILILLVKNIHHKPIATVTLNMTYTLGFYRQIVKRLFNI